MARDFAAAFYSSERWHKCRKAFWDYRTKIDGCACERCGEPAEIAHHKIYLTPHNINDASIALSLDNLEALCQDCHNKEHFSEQQQPRCSFDEDGRPVLLPPKIG